MLVKTRQNGKKNNGNDIYCVVYFIAKAKQ